ncbi:MAG TPA: thiamine phosphate synthase [Chitinophagaceae bacterium]|nr:thiamine phosphate synthase [Chitinophagaceae bacterium]
MNNKKHILSGLYLVLDPAMNEEMLFKRLELVLAKEVAAIQIWDHFRTNQDEEALIQQICDLSAPYDVPVLINNKWQHLKHTSLAGVHFDSIPKNIKEMKAEINRDIMIGLTCGNDLKMVRWAAEYELDYISFCSMFPSVSVSSCEIVTFETVKKARAIFKNSLFLAGGIYPGNLACLRELQYDGIAVVSGVMGSENPVSSIHQYYREFKK